MDRLTESLRTIASARVWAVVILAALVAGCGDPSSLDRQMEARRLSSELLVQFGRATDAANMAVMAGHDETSTGFAREAEQAALAVQRDADALKPLLSGLGYTGESRLLEEFIGRFAEYRELDHVIRGLAVENTNLKAQRLSFGPAQ